LKWNLGWGGGGGLGWCFGRCAQLALLLLLLLLLLDRRRRRQQQPRMVAQPDQYAQRSKQVAVGNVVKLRRN